MSRVQVIRFMGSGPSEDVSIVRIDIGQAKLATCT